MCTPFGAYARLYQWCLRTITCRQVLAVALLALAAFVAQPAANADVIYTFFDTKGNVVLEFSSPYIVTPTTAPVNISNFIVAPNGFLPCTLSIFNGSTTANTLGCVATSPSGALGALTTSGHAELWAITIGPFPTAAGSFKFQLADVMFGFAGDIPSGGGSITPEPASLLLFGTGLAAFGIWRHRRSAAK